VRSLNRTSDREVDDLTSLLINHQLIVEDMRCTCGHSYQPDPFGPISSIHQHRAEVVIDAGWRRQALIQLTELEDIKTAMRGLHTSDGAESPFCNECAHSWPCATIKTVRTLNSSER
jgi:hypothetical protein